MPIVSPGPAAERTLMGEAPRLLPIVVPALGGAVLLTVFAPGFSSFAARFRGIQVALAIELGVLGLVFWADAAVRLLGSWKTRSLAVGGAFGLARHPIFSWWLWSVLPTLALAFDSWPFLAVIPAFFLAARKGAAEEERPLEELFGEEYRAYRGRTNRFWPLPRLRGRGLRGFLRWAGFLALCGLGGLGIYFAAVRPIALNLGMTREERRSAWAGDALIPVPRQGFSQAAEYGVSAEELWPWIVQVGYRRAGWYNLDAINALAAPDYFFEGGGSARRIIPELQDLSPGDPVAIVPAQVFEALEVVPVRRLLLAGGIPRGPDGIPGPAPAREGMAVTWLLEIVPAGPGSCRLVSRFRTDFAGGPGMGILFGIVNELGGALLQQPAMFHGLRERVGGN